MAAAAAAAKPSPSVDPVCSLRGAVVHEDFSAMLNQTNVGANNNKFYRLQLLEGSPLLVHRQAGRLCVTSPTPRAHCSGGSPEPPLQRIGQPDAHARMAPMHTVEHTRQMLVDRHCRRTISAVGVIISV